jgi:plastocyanin
MRRLPSAAAAAALLLVPATARADKEITAGPSDQFNTPNVTMDQGERLTFRVNALSNQHDVISNDRAPDGGRLFRSPVIGPGQTAFVAGSQFLTTGSYAFFCSIHPNMTGNLTVTANGTAVPRPDTAGPQLGLGIADRRLSTVRRRRGLRVVVRTNEQARVRLSVSARIRGRRRTLGTRTLSLVANERRDFRLRLSRRGRALLRGQRRLRFTLSARGTDARNNASTRSTSRTLR